MKEKSSFKFIIISFKKNLISIILIIFIIGLIFFSNTNILAVKKALNLWVNSVIPSLLPFFIAIELLSHTNIPNVLGNILNNVMRPLFNVPGIGAFALIMGIISGYPTGAKLITNFRENNLCTKEECERLLTFTNNSGPLFILGTVGINLFGDTRTGVLLLSTHILACITVGILFSAWKSKSKSNTVLNNKSKIHANQNISFSNLGEILSFSISKSINTIVMIGGFIIFFSVIISILNNTHIFNILEIIITPFFKLININSDFISPLLTGSIELTNGIKQVALVSEKQISINIILCAFLLGFGGISILLQVYSIISKTDISIKPYIIGKFLHGLIASFYTYIIIKYVKFFNLDLKPVVAEINKMHIINISEFSNIYLIFFIIFGFFILLEKIKKSTI